jgi:hypothetical protein
MSKRQCREIIFFRVPRSSFRVMRSSEGRSLAQRVQWKLLGRSLAQICYSVAKKDAAELRGYSLTLRVQRNLDRVQHSSFECSIASRVYRS